MLVSPGGIQIYLANAEAIRQVTAKREAFPKPLESYKVLDIFGRNVITTEGGEWKQHRKVLSPSFNEKNNALVFAEACRQAQGMLRKWKTTSGDSTIREVPIDVMRLTLHIISKIGFGVGLLWPGEKIIEKESTQDAVFSSVELPEGHSMSYETSMDTLLANLVWVILTPKWLKRKHHFLTKIATTNLVGHLPFRGARKAYESFLNWGQYMKELFAQKVKEAQRGDHSEGMDIMGSLVRSSYGEQQRAGKSSSDHAEKEGLKDPLLSDSDILGNAFVMIVAGHETTASTLHFALMELATNPGSQRLLQKEIESIFGKDPPETWDYDVNINALLGGMVGAVLNEQLRIMPPVIVIPKQVSKVRDQVIVVDGKSFTLPAGAYMSLNVVGTHRNPKYWPSQPSKVTDDAHDLNDFRPERWLVRSGPDGSQHAGAMDSEEEEDFGGYTGHDTSAQLFRPTRGSYVPFSDGPRSCLGRRLAQVKVVAVLSVIFQRYSLELAVDEWATDDDVASMGKDQRRKLYRMAQDEARKTIRSATTQITLGLHEGAGFIPVRLVPKGEERFLSIVE